jgi:hypothetical protein
MAVASAAGAAAVVEGGKFSVAIAVAISTVSAARAIAELVDVADPEDDPPSSERR